MADYFVDGGRADDTGNGTTWALAKKTLAAALALATTSGDRVIVKYNALSATDAEVSADTTYTFAGDILLISASADDTGTAFTPTAMSTSYWIGNSTTNRAVTLNGAFTVHIYGITIRTAGSTTDNISIGASDGVQYSLEDCYIWSGNTSTASLIALGPVATNGAQGHIRLINTTLRFGATAQTLRCSAVIEMEGGSCSADGSAPSTLVTFNQNDVAGSTFTAHGVNLSHITGTLVGSATTVAARVRFIQCEFGASVTLLASSLSPANLSNAEATALDCSSGDEHYHLWHSNAFGDLTVSTSAYVTSDGAQYNVSGSKHSWKIVTTSVCDFHEPFISPWISIHHEGTSAITPYLESVCDNFTPKEGELYSEWMVKSNTGKTRATFNNSDRGSIKESTTDQAASSLGAGDWTGEPATPIFRKLAPSSSFTPAEIGDLCARVCVGIASKTVYIDPQIRGRS